VGCGEGTLISCLCEPAPCLAPLPPTTSTTRPYTLSFQPDIHVSSVAGLDISLPDLQIGIDALNDRHNAENNGGEANGYRWHPPRWEEVDVSFWNGGLEVVNEEFKFREGASAVASHTPSSIASGAGATGKGGGYECIVAMEV